MSEDDGLISALGRLSPEDRAEVDHLCGLALKVVVDNVEGGGERISGMGKLKVGLALALASRSVQAQLTQEMNQ